MTDFASLSFYMCPYAMVVSTADVQGAPTHLMTRILPWDPKLMTNVGLPLRMERLTSPMVQLSDRPVYKMLRWTITKSKTVSVFITVSVSNNTRFCVHFTFNAYFFHSVLFPAKSKKRLIKAHFQNIFFFSPNTTAVGIVLNAEPFAW